MIKDLADLQIYIFKLWFKYCVEDFTILEKEILSMEKMFTELIKEYNRRMIKSFRKYDF